MKKKITIGLITILIVIGLSGCIESNNSPEGGKNNSPISLIELTKNNEEETLVVSAVNQNDVLWSNIEIIGTYHSRYSPVVSEYVLVGDTIEGCKNGISLRYKPTNEIIGSWTFIEIDEDDREPMTITMNATEHSNDKSMDSVVGRATISFDSLIEGDTLVLQDIIYDLSYSKNDNMTTISLSPKLDIYFEGDMSETYEIGNEVRITVKILRVTFDHEYYGTTTRWNIELYEGHWEDAEYFTSHISSTTPYVPLKESVIEKV